MKNRKCIEMSVRKYFRFLVGLLISISLSGIMSAQQGEKKSVDSRGQWFVGVDAGSRVYFADHAKQLQLKDRISGGADLFVGKWIIPMVGARIGGSYQTLKGAAQTWTVNNPAPHAITGNEFYLRNHRLFKQKFDAVHIFGDILLDATTIFGGVNEDRLWTVAPFIGLGYAKAMSPPYEGDVPGSEMSLNIGLLNSFRISNSVDLNLDIRGAAVNDRFKVGKKMYPQIDRLNAGGRPYDGILSVNLGLTYRFGAKAKYKPMQMVYQPEPVYYYSEPIIEKVVEKVTEWKDIASDVLILFQINQSTLLNDGRVQIGFIAKLMHQYPESTYSITGYADEGTGNPDLNFRLSYSRAVRVKECLVTEFGISPSRLTTIPAGGIENRFYNDPALSRSVIISPNKN